MITNEDLQAAIAECQGARNPNANTCIKLAAFLTIQKALYGDVQEISGHSYSEPPEIDTGTASAISDSDFSAAIDGKRIPDVLYVLEDLMQAVSVLNPRLYAATMRKLNEI